jgi:hypothetical protein
MPDPWRYVEGALPEYRCDAYVLHPVLDLDDALGQLIGKRVVHDQLGRGLVSMGTYGEVPRTSLALWAEALAASTVPAATAASVLMSMAIAFPPLNHRSDPTFPGP